jgi:hypothetical protein
MACSQIVFRGGDFVFRFVAIFKDLDKAGAFSAWPFFLIVYDSYCFKLYNCKSASSMFGCPTKMTFELVDQIRRDR